MSKAALEQLPATAQESLAPFAANAAPVGVGGPLRRLDAFDAVLLDDIGYLQQDREEMEVLFTFLAERYERKSVLITSNLVFSQWDQIFKNPMTTAAAIDRLVHHAVILEMTGPSQRSPAAVHAMSNSGVESA